MENELIIELKEENIEIELEGNETVKTELTNDYRKLINKPKIEGIELIGDKNFEDLGLSTITNFELEKLLK